MDKDLQQALEPNPNYFQECYNDHVLDDLLLPLFPLELVLFPEQWVPLHIFEERYKQMIRDCLEAQGRAAGQQEFGIVLVEHEEINKVGCCARVAKVTRKYEDGRMDILTRGTRRFEIFLTNEEKSYLRGGVEFFDDDEGADSPSEGQARHALELFEQIRDLVAKPVEIPNDAPSPHKHLSFRLAAALPLDLSFKQQLLSIRNETERLRNVDRALQQLIPHLTAIRRARQKAGGNGDALLKTP